MEFVQNNSNPDTASTAAVQDRSLGDVFSRIFRIMQRDELSSFQGQSGGSKLDEFVENCDFCMERVHIEGLISKNEDIDDIQTSTLPVSASEKGTASL